MNKYNSGSRIYDNSDISKNKILIIGGIFIVVIVYIYNNNSDIVSMLPKSNELVKYVGILLGLVLFLQLLKCFEKMNNNESEELNEEFNNLSIPKIDQHVCSRQCCKFTQWPVPFNTHEPNKDSKEYDKYIGSNFSCNLGQTGGGCVCFEKSDYEYLSNHGQE